MGADHSAGLASALRRGATLGVALDNCLRAEAFRLHISVTTF